MSQRFEGRNLEDALESAATALGVERYRLTHRVLLEKRGFLGGVKRVVVEVDVNPDATPPVTAAVPAAVVAPAVAAATPRPVAERSAPRERGARGGRGGRGGRSRDGNRGRGGDRDRPRRQRGPDDLRPGDFERMALADIPDQGPESEAAAAVHAWCEEVVDLAHLNVLVRTEENDAQIMVRMYGRDASRLIDRHGELLDAIQVLANKALIGRGTEKDIELDCEAFKEHRVADLGEQARTLADKVRRDKREQLLPAMSPIERRIVHLALQDDADVTTESRGEGFYKRVAIVPRSEATAGATPTSEP